MSIKIRKALRDFYHSLFLKVTLLQDSTYIVQVPLPVSCARSPSNVGSPTQKGVPAQQSAGFNCRRQVGAGTGGAPFFRGKSASNFHLNFAQGVQIFSEGGHILVIVLGAKLLFGPST